MNQTIIAAGKLISTTDIKLAAKLGELVKIDELTSGERVQFDTTPENTICFMHHGELFEVAA